MIEVRPADHSNTAILIELFRAQLAGHGLAADRRQVVRGIGVAFWTDAPLVIAMEGSRGIGR